MVGKLDWIKDELESLKEQGLFKTQRVLQTGNGAEIIIDGKKLLNFCSNNYLGLATDPELKKAAKEAIDKYGVGAGAVRMIAGTTVLHVLLEEKLTEFKKTEGAIFFQSGFVTNSAVIPIMVTEGDVVFSDELNHASIIDGCRLSKAVVVKYKHNDMVDLEKQIKNASFKKGLLVSDGVFSMDGDIADLPNLVKLAEKYSLILMIDDSHGEGVLGEYGRGIAEYYNLHGRVDIEMGTLSKAFGVVGGFVAGKKEVVEYLRQKARPFLFSTSMTIPDVAACIKGIEILSKSKDKVKTLWENTRYFKDKMQKLGFDLGKSQTPIIPVMLPSIDQTKEFSKKLFEKGIFASAIVYPMVAKEASRIRVMISAAHTQKHLDAALKAFEEIGRELKVI